MDSSEAGECAEARQPALFCGETSTSATKTYFGGLTLPKRDQAGSRDEKMETRPRMGGQRQP